MTRHSLGRDAACYEPARLLATPEPVGTAFVLNKPSLEMGLVGRGSVEFTVSATHLAEGNPKVNLHFLSCISMFIILSTPFGTGKPKAGANYWFLLTGKVASINTT